MLILKKILTAANIIVDWRLLASIVAWFVFQLSNAIMRPIWLLFWYEIESFVAHVTLSFLMQAPEHTPYQFRSISHPLTYVHLLAIHPHCTHACMHDSFLYSHNPLPKNAFKVQRLWGLQLSTNDQQTRIQNDRCKRQEDNKKYVKLLWSSEAYECNVVYVSLAKNVVERK